MIKMPLRKCKDTSAYSNSDPLQNHYNSAAKGSGNATCLYEWLLLGQVFGVTLDDRSDVPQTLARCAGRCWPTSSLATFHGCRVESRTAAVCPLGIGHEQLWCIAFVVKLEDRMMGLGRLPNPLCEA